ncbi:TPA: pyruvate dehydrogenase (acetyl-transferring) E1 component subunit alpha [Legionella pneumophila]|nr:pyruvate dehydrogenase (acetyl-transferring) E1 component subunit alpha [Legionella pneumophila]HAT2067346.1 pyruvate dehydrogenase (acetyl-transferring) E1 component subunit alpha [Legionella pneumophila]HAT8593495.1 pyruvate dehydrogenase (acetyl-transferring) E1 component subunit alpha [Legionella pneumophila]HAU1577566.1 pyruvate dehydrogenase (acetyl-transferring) E1 component subunit alpha [Legionella pneumophila]HAU1681800.1 pyruvate dehydrogenase (acetyl-transferring) E1 component su
MNDLDLLYQMILIRRFEEKAAELYSAGKIRGFLHLYIGEEAVAVGSMCALSKDDNVIATYREHGHALVCGIPASSIMLEMYGKQEGCSHGRGGSMHLFDISRKFYGGNAIVGGGIPLCVGLALADKMQHKRALSACYIGDGSIAEGVFHESANIAALWKLPVLFLCENNFYAMGTKLSEHESQTDLAKKARSYNIKAVTVDGMDVLAVKEATEKAVHYIREGKGPYFIEFKTYRFRAHSMYDPDLYRDKAEIEKWKKRDPIKTFFAQLTAQGTATMDDLDAIEKKVHRVIAEAVDAAEKGTWEPIEHLTKNIYYSGGVI